MELIDPDQACPRRGSFHQRYAFARKERSTRLLDHLLAIAPHDDPEYFDEPEPGQFAVVDVVTKEKAWFELPYGASAGVVTGMIESCFASSAFRVGDKLWFV